MVELTASGDPDQVEVKLRETLDAHGLQMFARIDHAAGARKADVELEADVLLIFGNVHVGTPLVQADPRAGIELPLRMLIWQDPAGTHVGYLDPRELAARYALGGHEQTLEQQAAVLVALAAAARADAASTRRPRSGVGVADRRRWRAAAAPREPLQVPLGPAHAPTWRHHPAPR
jgi:uncharacterized protein (DUF302 family)